MATPATTDLKPSHWQMSMSDKIATSLRLVLMYNLTWYIHPWGLHKEINNSSLGFVESQKINICSSLSESCNSTIVSIPRKILISLPFSRTTCCPLARSPRWGARWWSRTWAATTPASTPAQRTTGSGSPPPLTSTSKCSVSLMCQYGKIYSLLWWSLL